MILGLLLLVAAASSSPVFQTMTCPVCEPEFCPKSFTDCPLGLVQDPCGCCPVGVCQLSVGQRCLDSRHTPAMSLTDLRVYTTCGQKMNCVQRTDVDPSNEHKESVCMCIDSRPVCGADNRTYPTPCDMNAVNGFPLIRHSGPCAVAPQITVGPVSNTVPLGDSIAFGCEVYGVPVPNIAWQFYGFDGTTKMLPGDDVSTVVQNRGGPDSYMVTSWIQIVSARIADSGKYLCIANNKNGEVRADAEIRVRPIF